MPTALIVGAGIGGLASGIALRRAGWDVRIFERAPAPRDIGFALGLAPNAMAALRELGVVDAVTAHAMTPTIAELRQMGGRMLRRFEAERSDLPAGDLLGVILRPTLHKILLDAAGPETVELNRPAKGFRVDGVRVSLDLEDGSSVSGDVLVGADGVGSVVRAYLHPGEPPPRPSGYFAVRGLSPAIAHLEGLHGLWYFGRGVESGMVRASASHIYWYISLLAADVKAGPDDVSRVIERCCGGFDDQFHAIVGTTPPDQRRLDELFVRAPLRSWGTGPVTLAGDAAHPMLPHTGQGAAQALEDGAALGRAVAMTADVIGALRSYEAIRSRRTERVARMGPRIARITTTANPVVSAIRNAVIRVVPEASLIKAFTQAGA